jgi:hypothetical protein
MFPIDFEVQRSNALDIEVEILFQALECYSFHLESPYHTWTTLGRKMFPIEFESKGQGHWTSK